MGKMKDTVCFDTPPEQPRVHVFDLEELDLPGQLLITIYDDRVTVAHRGRPSARWTAPSTALVAP